jgi:hypothetical protein
MGLDSSFRWNDRLTILFADTKSSKLTVLPIRANTHPSHKATEGKEKPPPGWERVSKALKIDIPYLSLLR